MIGGSSIEDLYSLSTKLLGFLAAVETVFILKIPSSYFSEKNGSFISSKLLICYGQYGGKVREL